jgi:hypothetical protein
MNIEKLFQQINRLSSEAEWTNEELREELKAGGIDPDSLIFAARKKLAELKITLDNKLE